MKQPRITRRQFFKASAFGVGSLALSSVALATVVSAPSQQARAEAEQPNKLAIPQPTFNPIAATTTFGPPTDISAGWDGTLWAIDASGAPHLYDPTADTWNAYGEGIEAATAIGSTLYVFKGGYYITVDLTTMTVTSGPTSVAATWPSLPDSFKLRLTGATSEGGKLVLFNGGWYVYADGSIPRKKLADIEGWPTTPNWADGLIDAVFFSEIDSYNLVYLFRGDEYIVANLFLNLVISGPQPAKSILPPSLATMGTDAATYYPTTGDTYFFHGASVVVVPSAGGAGQTYYIPKLFAQWPVTWNPMLNHAPSGRMGNLWCATTAQGIVQHDGENWNTIAGRSASVAVGQDNSVYVVSGDNQTIDTFVVGTGWVATATAPVQLTKVAVGDDDHVFALGTDSSVHRLVRSSNVYSYTTVSLGAGVPNPTNMVANADGTLWHCNSGSPNAGRFISEGTAPSATIPVKNGVVTAVLKVASTGFGAAHLLVTQTGQSQPQVYRYDSPYVFKTSKSYTVIGSSTSRFAQGLGNLYFVQEVSNPMPNELYVRFVALDQHTGKEFASYTPPGNTNQYTGMVFDPVNELVYVASAPVDAYYDNNTPGTLYALDARTLQVKWTSSAYRGIDATPALHNGLLCFGDRAALLYCIDTKAALATAAQNKPIPNKWVFVIDTNGPVNRVSTPLFNGDQVIVMTWALEYDPSEGLVLYTTESVDVTDGTGNNFGLGLPSGTIPKNVVNEYLVLQPPLVKPLLFPDYSAPSLAIIVRAVNSIIAWNLESQDFSQLQFNLPGGTIASSLTYDDGTRLGSGLSGQSLASRTRLWFGDDQGNLWALNQQFKPMDGTPYQVSTNTEVFTAPTLYKDPQGGLTVLYGVYDPNFTLPPSLYGYDPDNGNHASVPTGVTQITTLSPTVTNGVIYAGGWGAGLTQVFGIRVDELPQALRDFIIESQMMQDPDPTASGGDPANNIPPSFARYQTHLSVVDDQKNPIPREPIKIWCDTPNTKITVDGVAYTVGPDDAAFASVRTGTDGALVLTIDATDYFAPTLRVWASFMDSFERIVINPDAEFHQRVMTAHADANDDDPQKVNLQTATNYNGKPLFTADEKNANPPTPQQIANSIQQVNKGLGLNNSSKGLYRKMMRAMGVKHKNQRISVKFVGGEPTSVPAPRGEEADPPDKYMAYADLPGATHFSTNIPSVRLAPIAQPIGLSFIRPDGDCTKGPVFSAMSHTDARAAIDTLEGVPWQPNDPYSKNPGGCTGVKPQVGTVAGVIGPQPQHTFNIFQDFWNWLKGLFDKVLQVILSIAEDILAGIQYVVDGILHVFKAIIKVLEDVFPFLGSFFKMLEKLIDDVVTALSVLFHFGEIIWTHKWLVNQFNERVADLTNAITSSIEPNINSFFRQDEAAIKGFFKSLRAEFSSSGNPQLSNTKGYGQTPHSTFNLGPKDGTPSSQATQCTWGTHKLRSGLPSANAINSLNRSAVDPQTPGAVSDDPVSDFFKSFVARLTNDPTLSGAVAQLNSDFGNLVHVKSASQFFSTLMVTLLDIIETLVLSALVVANDLIDGLLTVIQDAITAVVNILNTEIEIPVLTWLYETLFKEKLTLLNMATLVAAIPVTVIFRVVEGKYPSQAGLPTSGLAAGAMQTNHATAALPVAQEVLGIFVGIFQLVQGAANSVGDAEEEAPPAAGYVSVGCGFLIEVFTFPLINHDADTVSNADWAVYGISVFAAISLVAGVPYQRIDGKMNEPASPQFMSLMSLFLSVTALAASIAAYVIDKKTDGVTNAGFAEEIIATIVGMLNPVKLSGGEAAVIVAAIDVLGGIVEMFISIIVAIEANTSLPDPRRLTFFPFVAVGGGVQEVPAHP